MRANIQLSQHFSLKELTNTMFDEFAEENMDVDEAKFKKLEELCSNILEPIREEFRLPMIIHSGYRCEALNEKVGGSTASQHTFAEAADFHVRGLDDLEGSTAVFNWIYKKSKIPFGQVIHEVKRTGVRESIWIHISLGEPHRHKSEVRQVLVYRNGLYTFLQNAQG